MQVLYKSAGHFEEEFVVEYRTEGQPDRMQRFAKLNKVRNKQAALSILNRARLSYLYEKKVEQTPFGAPTRVNRSHIANSARRGTSTHTIYLDN